MRIPRWVVFGIVTLALIGVAWAADPFDEAADAFVPENDRIAQLERRVAQLEARLSIAEQKLPLSWTVPAMHWAPAAPTPAWPQSVAPPQPLPQPGEQEMNGVKFRLFLLSDEFSAPTRPASGHNDSLRSWHLLRPYAP